MKRLILTLLAFLPLLAGHSETVEKRFTFGEPVISRNGAYQTVGFGNTRLAGITGEPALPWHAVVLMLPPGEAAVAIEVIREEETVIPGSFTLFPQQAVRPLSTDKPAPFAKSEAVYAQDRPYPADPAGHLMTQFLDGYGFALCTFTPLQYNPARHSVTYARSVTVRVTTRPDPAAAEALKNHVDSGSAARSAAFAMNPGMAGRYIRPALPAVNYDYLVVCPSSFKNEFQPLINMYAAKGTAVRVVTTDSIQTAATGYDLTEKIRNFIIAQRQNHSIGYVLLAGNPSLVPARGFYCQVNSGGSYYTDSNIPADLYYSGLDGTYDANGNHINGEVADNPDLLPELSVARFTVNDTAELHRMIRKTVSYQTNPVPGEFGKPLLAGEYLYNDPVTYGSDYMELLVNDRTDNGYFTHGIPSATNDISRLYDIPGWSWSAAGLLASLNGGNSCIHHLGHANTTYMMRLSISAVTDANFAQVNGVIHNYQFLYTQGCYDGAFDAGCIAARAVSINNWLAAGVFNSRYGWFNQGTTDGPSQHLEREFVSAMYTDTLPDRHIGTAHRISKIETAPWVSLPGEFEPGAQRWCHYCCNVFGDPAMELWTSEPSVFTTATWTGAVDTNWNNAGNWSPATTPTSLSNVVIPTSPRNPVITASSTAWCHDLTVTGSGNLTIPAGKSVVVYGSVILATEP